MIPMLLIISFSIYRARFDASGPIFFIYGVPDISSADQIEKLRQQPDWNDPVLIVTGDGNCSMVIFGYSIVKRKSDFNNHSKIACNIWIGICIINYFYHCCILIEGFVVTKRDYW